MLTAAGNNVARTLLLARIMFNTSIGHTRYAKRLPASVQQPMGDTLLDDRFLEELATVVTVLLQQHCGGACAYVLKRTLETGEVMARGLRDRWSVVVAHGFGSTLGLRYTLLTKVS